MPPLASFVVLVVVVFLIHAPAADGKFAPLRQRIFRPAFRAGRLPPGSLLRDAFSGAHAFFGLTPEPPFLWPFFPNGLLVTASRRHSARTSSGSAMRKFSHCPSSMCRIKTLRQPGGIFRIA
jgi:hypothetical protein